MGFRTRTWWTQEDGSQGMSFTFMIKCYLLIMNSTLSNNRFSDSLNIYTNVKATTNMIYQLQVTLSSWLNHFEIFYRYASESGGGALHVMESTDIKDCEIPVLCYFHYKLHHMTIIPQSLRVPTFGLLLLVSSKHIPPANIWILTWKITTTCTLYFGNSQC